MFANISSQLMKDEKKKIQLCNMMKAKRHKKKKLWFSKRQADNAAFAQNADLLRAPHPSI